MIQVASRVLWFGENIKQAIDALRIHHQLLPPRISYETGIDKVSIVASQIDRQHGI